MFQFYVVFQSCLGPITFAAMRALELPKSYHFVSSHFTVATTHFSLLTWFLTWLSLRVTAFFLFQNMNSLFEVTDSSVEFCHKFLILSIVELVALKLERVNFSFYMFLTVHLKAELRKSTSALSLGITGCVYLLSLITITSRTLLWEGAVPSSPIMFLENKNNKY